MVDEDAPYGILSHYGIKGMKWGVRRNPRELRRARGKKEWEPAKLSEDAKRAKTAADKAKKGGVSALSNQELQQLNQRINLEKQYTQLTTKDKSTTNAGSKFAKELASNMAKEEVRKVVKKHSVTVGKIALSLVTPFDFTKIKT